MATRGTAFSRTMDYFRSVGEDEARAALKAATEIVADRMGTPPAAKTRRTRKARAAGADPAQASLPAND